MATAKVMIYNYETADNDGDVKRNGKKIVSSAFISKI